MRALITPRLLLEPFLERDAEELYSIRGDALAMEHWDWPNDLDTAQTKFVAGILCDLMAQGTSLFWTVRLKETRDFLGVVDLSDRADDRADLGFMIRRDFWGRGYGLEATRAAIEEGWRSGLTRLSARTHADNSRSIALLRSLGFSERSASLVEIRPGVIRNCRFFELHRQYGEAP